MTQTLSRFLNGKSCVNHLMMKNVRNFLGTNFSQKNKQQNIDITWRYGLLDLNEYHPETVEVFVCFIKF